MIDSVLRKAIETRISQAGLDWLKLRSFELRSTQKTVALQVDLAGEDRPVELAARYRVEDGAVVVESVEASRPWMTEALSLALIKHGGRIALPGGLVGKMVRSLL